MFWRVHAHARTDLAGRRCGRRRPAQALEGGDCRLDGDHQWLAVRRDGRPAAKTSLLNSNSMAKSRAHFPFEKHATQGWFKPYARVDKGFFCESGNPRRGERSCVIFRVITGL